MQLVSSFFYFSLFVSLKKYSPVPGYHEDSEDGLFWWCPQGLSRDFSVQSKICPLITVIHITDLYLFKYIPACG